MHSIGGVRIAAKLNAPTALETDCLTNRVLDRSQACFIVDEAISMADKIRLLEIEKVNRDGNMAAHRIAAYCRTVLTSGVLHNSVPPCVKEQMMLDCNLNV
jgi:hypothetical protein